MKNTTAEHKAPERSKNQESIFAAKQTVETPVFNHNVINKLYEKGIDIRKSVIDEILGLPRETVIQDLTKVLNDATARYNFLTTDPDLESDKTTFPFHALAILAELKSEESLETVLTFIQDEEIAEYYLGDFLSELLWNSLYLLGKNQLEVLKNFITNEDAYVYSKSEVSLAVCQLGMQNQDRRKEVISWYKSIFQHYDSMKDDDPRLNPELLGVLVSDTIKLNATELLTIIEQLFDQDRVDVEMSGKYSVVDEEMFENHGTKFIEEVLSIKEVYARAKEIDDAASFEDDDFNYVPLKGKSDKGGMCPCGSGKKHKNCCGE